MCALNRDFKKEILRVEKLSVRAAIFALRSQVLDQEPSWNMA